MNWQHLAAFLWLRWRILRNQWRRGGALNAVLMTLVTVAAVVLAVPLFVGSLLLGLYVLPSATPAQVMYVWDGMIVAFVFFWMIGLITDLQRTESLSLLKFLHLPVSVEGAFLINYLSSLVRLSLIVFVPVMLGLCLGLAFSRGIVLLAGLPLVATFLLMVTALTYQFQGWLASLMSNPRRRRTVVVAVTAVFILLAQLPNLLNVLGQRHFTNRNRTFLEDRAKLDRAFRAQEIGVEEYQNRERELSRQERRTLQQGERERIERTLRVMNLVLPIGWVPLGMSGAAEGNLAPAALACLGFMLFGTASLWRAYRTTMGIYQGQFTAGKSRPAPASSAASLPVPARPRKVLLVERRVPGLSEPTAAIALSGLRSLTRSPEAKMVLLSPIVLGFVFGSMILQSPGKIPEPLRALAAIGGAALSMLGTLQLMANQFGFDRDGFRVFVLCAASRRDILLGKNLAFAPLVLGMSLVMLIVVEVLCPLRPDHFLAMFPQFVSMFLVFCSLTNLISIYAPLHVAAGSLRPSSPKLVPGLLQFAMITVFFPLTQAPTLVPLGVEAALEHLGWLTGMPVCLVLALAECAVFVLIYRLCLKWQGRLLQRREQKILESVTSRGT